MSRLALILCLALAACTFDQSGSGVPTGAGPDAGDTDSPPLSAELGGEPRGFEVDPPDDQWPYSAAERAALLVLANTADLATLDDDAAIDHRAAENIVAYRLGPDAQPGTDDDETFDDLDELDSISYVGPSTFEKLIAYAYAMGMI
jgi:hypothetical protein